MGGATSSSASNLHHSLSSEAFTGTQLTSRANCLSHNSSNINSNNSSNNNNKVIANQVSTHLTYLQHLRYSNQHLLQIEGCKFQRRDRGKKFQVSRKRYPLFVEKVTRSLPLENLFLHIEPQLFFCPCEQIFIFSYCEQTRGWTSHYKLYIAL